MGWGCVADCAPGRTEKGCGTAAAIRGVADCATRRIENDELPDALPHANHFVGDLRQLTKKAARGPRRHLEI
jgi:hypothetical protein